MGVQLRHEDITGANLTGSNGATNRTYTLANADAVQAQFSVIVQGAALQVTVHYTLVSDVLTFLQPVFDSMAITLDYFTLTAGPSIGLTYCSVTGVQAELQTETAFDATTVPTENQVTTFILQAEAEIDRKTKHSWRETQVLNEFYSVSSSIRYNSRTGYKIPLNHRNIRTLDTDEGDKVEIWDGTQYIDYLTEKTQERGSDFWLDLVEGALFVRTWSFPFWTFEKAIRMSYRYGESTVPADIEAVCTKIVARKILTMEDRSFNLSETDDGRNMFYDQRVTELSREINSILRDRTEVFVI